MNGSSTSEVLRGRAHVFGKNVDTDVIIPARYCTSIDAKELGEHCMDGADETFAQRVQPGDMIVAGDNFGCGSSRENAPLAIVGAGVSCVIAESFARIFYRNCINIGLPIMESVEAAQAIAAGDEVEVELSSGTIRDLTTGRTFQAVPMSDATRSFIAGGGMVAHVRRKLAEQAAGQADAAR